ncbi:hypothetical protein [Streptacidiphilus sp. MAP5-3]|uniref:hypothetical protein n=1 Tax=unclassified Streptacidiphilus TaxID=2643834 RepID=UPI003511ADC4
MSDTTNAPLQLAGGNLPPQGGGGHGSMHWGLLAGVPLIALGVLLAVGGLVLAVKLGATARKSSERGPGVLLFLVGAALAALGFWLA